MPTTARQTRPGIAIAAALLIGGFIGYGLASIEAHREVEMIRRSIDMAQPSTVTAASLDQAQPRNDLQIAIDRIEQRARRANQLGDPTLADMWRAEAQRLRAAQARREQNH